MAFQVDDFSGGITDNYISGQPNQARAMDNFNLIPYGNKAKPLSRPGSLIYDETSYQLPSAASRVGTLFYWKTLEKLIAGNARAFYYLTSSWQTLVGPTGNQIFPSGVQVDNYVSLSAWNRQFLYSNDYYTNPGLLYVDSGGDPTAITAGLPALASDPVITPSSDTNKSFLYRFTYYYTYTAGTVVFEMEGPTTEVAVSDADAPETNQNDISGIPILANGTTLNYDTVAVKIRIARTVNAGTAFYNVGEVTNGTTVYADTMSDADLILRSPLFTDGGVAENDPPPLCKYVHVSEDQVAMYANIQDGSELKSNTFRLSKPGEVAHVPSDFEESVDDEITGVSSLKSRWVVFCTSGVWRVEGFFDSLGQGTIQKTKISDVTGCVSNQSIVQTVDGIYWAGTDGFYFTDGFKVLKITEQLNDSYAALNLTVDQKKRIYGKFDSKHKRVHWGVQADSGESDNDSMWVLDLKYGVSPMMPFTTWSNGTSFAPCSFEFVNGNLIRADRRGYLFAHDEVTYTDPKIDTTTAAVNWTTKTIIWNYQSCALDFGLTGQRKFVTRISTTMKNITNLSVQINVTNDDGRHVGALTPIRFRGNLIWDDPDLLWADPDLLWDYAGLIIEQRRMPRASLRCTYKEIQITNGVVPIVNSDVYGTATVDNSAKTVTLNEAATYNWPAQAEDYYISFASDDYEREYLISERTTDDVLTYVDSEDRSPTGVDLEWVLRGQPKGEVANILSYSMDYTEFGKTQDAYSKSESGEVGS